MKTEPKGRMEMNKTKETAPAKPDAMERAKAELAASRKAQGAAEAEQGERTI